MSTPYRSELDAAVARAEAAERRAEEAERRLAESKRPAAKPVKRNDGFHGFRTWRWGKVAAGFAGAVLVVVGLFVLIRPDRAPSARPPRETPRVYRPLNQPAQERARQIYKDATLHHADPWCRQTRAGYVCKARGWNDVVCNRAGESCRIVP